VWTLPLRCCARCFCSSKRSTRRAGRKWGTAETRGLWCDCGAQWLKRVIAFHVTQLPACCCVRAWDGERAAPSVWPVRGGWWCGGGEMFRARCRAADRASLRRGRRQVRGVRSRGCGGVEGPWGWRGGGVMTPLVFRWRPEQQRQRPLRPRSLLRQACCWQQS